MSRLNLFEAPPVIRTTTLRQNALDAAQAAELDLMLPVVEMRTIVIMGTPQAGKTTLTKALQGLLAGLRLRVLDVSGAQLPEMPGDDPVVIYVIQSRGRTEDDALALEQLRRHRVAVVQNINRDELTYVRSDVEITPAAGTTLGYVVPLALDATGPGEAERAVLLLIIARLLDDDRTRVTVDQLSRAAFQRQARLREVLTNRLARVRRTARHRSMESVLDAVADLTRMVTDRHLADAVDAALNQLIAHPKDLADASGEVADSLSAAASQLVTEYNVYAFTRGNRSAATGPHSELAGPYVRVREELLGWLGNVVNAGEVLNLTDDERKLFGRHQAVIESDRVEIALLGQFSSGKSALVNTILGFGVNDQDRTFLPTSRAVETAILTRVAHADRPSSSATWLSAVSLTFFERLDSGKVGSRDAYRVREQEIEAFLRWMDNGDIDLGDCVVWPSQEESATAQELVRELRAWREATPAKTAFVYGEEHPLGPWLPDRPIAERAEVQRFRRPAPVTWTPSTGLGELFEAAKRPEHALRMEWLQVGDPHDFLQHAAFLDTPGTDAPIPHHRTIARSIMQERSLPVIYCFPATHAAAKEDRENLMYLGSRGVGGTGLARFFFVITQKGAVARTECDQIRGAVHRQLTSLGIGERKVYFTEVLAERNQEFRDLVTDLGQFIKQNRAALVESWIDDAQVLIGNVRDRAEQGLAAIDASAEEKRRTIERLNAQQAALGLIAARFETQDRPWAVARLAGVLADGPGQITETIENLGTKDELAAPDLASTVATKISDTDARVRSRIENLRSGLVARVTAQVAEELPARTMTSHDCKIPDALFSSAGVQIAVERQVWRPIYRRFLGGKKQDTEANRERIAKAWELSRDSGNTTARAGLDGTLVHLTADLRRISEAITADLDAMRSPPESKDELLEATHEAVRWIDRLSVLRNRYERSQVE
ncbi:hypothetical protein JOF56_005181 [Kibdelosporangium banguiense]|uniref:Dynamin N-terminal domain-containing protein n=1 Tax=Kibdelosporangium banguiense TaxID=1365924 RepID=A0ABS4TK46_9PSEU|nr:dynamin family protein [Kibdelosporangium banguiense]MBP2324796.1 hypothetical protein [Kibdelosporangium banguiense]